MKRTVSTLLTASILSLSLVFSLTVYSSGNIPGNVPHDAGKLPFTPVPSTEETAQAQGSDSSALPAAYLPHAGTPHEDGGDSQGEIRETDDMAANDSRPAQPQRRVGDAVMMAFAGRLAVHRDKGAAGDNAALLSRAPLRAYMPAPPGIGRADVPAALSSVRKFIDIMPEHFEKAGIAALKLPAGAKFPAANDNGLRATGARVSSGRAAVRLTALANGFAARFTRAPPPAPLPA